MLLALLLLLAPVAEAGRHRVIIVQSDDLQAYGAPVPAFLEALAVEPQPLRLNVHGRESEARAIVARLREERPEVVFCLGAKACYAVQQELPHIPLVHAVILEPERYGIVGRQVTGVTMTVPPVTYLSQLVGFFPTVKRIGVLRGTTVSDERIAELRAAAAEVGVSLVVEQISAPKEARSAFQKLVDRQIDALWLPPDREILDRDAFRALFDETRRRHMPLLVDTANMVEAGGLFSLVPDPDAVGKQAAALVQQILDGAAPAVLPREDPEKLLTVLNLRTLDQAGIAFDPLLRDFVDVLVAP